MRIFVVVYNLSKYVTQKMKYYFHVDNTIISIYNKFNISLYDTGLLWVIVHVLYSHRILYHFYRRLIFSCATTSLKTLKHEKSLFFNSLSGISKQEVHCLLWLVQPLCDSVWLQKRKDGLIKMNHFSLVYNELELFSRGQVITISEVILQELCL